MATIKKIVLISGSKGAQITVSYVLWADVPPINQANNVDPLATSAYSGISAPELQAIRDGQVAERLDTVNFALGTPIPEIKAAMIAAWTAWQAQVSAQNNLSREGNYWDGASWHVA
jgi:hypothetical protein